MDSTYSDDMEAIAEEASKKSNSRYASYAKGINGEPESVPRVGDQYQAVIPDLMTAYGSSKAGQEHNAECSVSIGKPISVMWLKGEKFSGFVEAVCEKQTLIREPKSKTETRTRRRKIVLGLPSQKNFRNKKNRLPLSVCPFPGSFSESWDDVERARFLVGLYTLGKDLNAVKKMVESKTMEDILSFYYGSFYGSKEYKRWSEGQNPRRRKSVQGQKLLSGWRQQELLSRISCRVSDEGKTALIEVSRAFREGTVSLEEYVFALKDTVGVDILVEALQIGKGKKDLTGAAMEPPRTHHSVPPGSEALSGKPWSALSSADIISLLTGGFRLSKARSNDLFWEAVWPRLLARGWHSEQPEDHFRKSLVFLIPSIKSFSRRELVKGTHYFDSISDVLSKVASEPEILELEMVAVKDNVETLENGKDLGRKGEDPDEFQGNKPRQDVKQSSVNENPDGVKFTIVDTGMANGGRSCEIRDFRSLLAENGCNSTISSCFSNEPGAEASEELEIAAGERAETPVYVDRRLDTGKSDLGDKIGTQVKTCYTVLTNEVSTFSGEKKPNSKESFVKSQEKPKHRIDIDLNVPHVPPGFEEVRPEHIADLNVPQVPPGFEEVKPEHIADLNVPQVPPGFEEVKPEFIADAVQNVKSSLADQSSVKVEEVSRLFNGEASTNQEVSRRCSTRNRPLSAKALEAIAFGFLGSSRKKRNNPESSRSNSRAKFARFHSHTVHSESYGGKDASNPDET